MENKETLETGGGNTKPHRIVPSKKWCFTLNNYTQEILETLETTFRKENIKYIIGEEIGESGTPHLQGYLEHTIKIRPIEHYKQFKGIHWEKTKGNEKQNIAYCSKDGKYRINNLKKELTQDEKRKALKLISKETMYDWQKSVVETCESEPDERSIWWYWEPIGNVGKSALTKYLCFEYDALLLGGKGNDILYAATEHVNNKNSFYEKNIFILDLSRSLENFVSYDAIEKLKNGHWFSGKYESKSTIIAYPHVIVFANFKPDKDKLSDDRWRVVRIK